MFMRQRFQFSSGSILLGVFTFLPVFLFSFVLPSFAASFSDTFTNTDGTTLHNHNNLWDCDLNSEAVIQSNKIVENGISAQKCLSNSFQDGSASFVVNFSGSDNNNSSAVYLHYLDPNNFYQCNVNAHDGYVIFKNYHGNFSVLELASGSPGASEHTLACSISGSTITLTVDGVQRMQVTDTDLPSAGRAGFELKPNITVDDYSSTDTGVGPTPTITPTATPTPSSFPFSDSFTESDGTTLHDHNGVWNCDFDSEAIIQSNKVVTSGVSTQKCVANSFQDGSASFVVNFAGSSVDDTSAVYLHYLDPNNFYQCNVNAAHGFVIFKMYQGNFSVLELASGSLGAGEHTLACSISGSTITLTVDGVQRAQANDADLPNSGRGGFELVSGTTFDDYNSTDTIVINSAPSVNSISNVTINEGTIYNANGSFSDSDSTSWTGTVDYGDGSGVQSLALNSDKTFSLNHLYKDNNTHTLTVTVMDNEGAVGAEAATITVENVNPTVSTITAPINPILVNTSLTASASFSDVGVLDTHIATWNWGDGNTTSSSVVESNGSGSVSDNHSYAAAGVYTITLTVTDNNGGVGSSIFQYLTVYNPSAGALSGSKEYISPVGAVAGNFTATGKANFGVQAKYVAGNTVPQGNTKLSFNFGNIDFQSTSYQWLVVNGAKATLKGNGTLNGVSGYTFLVSAIDGSQTGGQDLIRYQIKDSTGNVVYDTQPGAADTANPTTSVTKGKIKVN